MFFRKEASQFQSSSKNCTFHPIALKDFNGIAD
jgi:hypothetical protein